MSSGYSVGVIVPGENDRKLNVQTRDSMPVRELREIIARQLGLQPINIRLTHSDVPMEDGQNVSYYGLQSTSKVYVTIFEQGGITVTVSGISGATTVEKIYPGDTAGVFLQRYQKKQGSSAAFKLTRGGTEVESGQQLRELGIQSGEMLHVSTKVQGGLKL